MTRTMQTMKIKNANIKKLFRVMFAVAGISLTSCSADLADNVDLDRSPYVESIDVSVASRRVKGSTEYGEGERTGIDLDELIPYSMKFNENTVIQVSQQTRNKLPFTSSDDTYDYVYKKDSQASWDDEATYNFTPDTSTDVPLEWNSIANAGVFNAGYALYALYFPNDNQIQETIEGDSHIYSVRQDQRDLDDLKASDILGSYHSTPAIFSRIRFKMHHFMTYLRIRLYVPVFDATLNTGYREGALLSATLNHVSPKFTVNWAKVTSGDTEAPEVRPYSEDDEIIMYQHPLEDGQTEHEITEIEYKKFLTQGYYDQGLGTATHDRVRVYDFSVLLPVQNGFINEDGVERPFTESDFLNFYFRTNSGAETRYYFNQSLVGNQEGNVGDDSNELHMGQGNFQYLELYVPRIGNKLIIVGANVKPWTQKGTDMILNQQNPEEDD